MKKLASYSLISLVLFIVWSNVLAQSQPPCSGSVSITDPSQGQANVLAVVSNSAQASFTATGPVTYHGSGYYWVYKGIPSGAYTIVWNDVSGCSAPKKETKNTDAKGSVAFAGNYEGLGTYEPAPPPIQTYTDTNLQQPASESIPKPKEIQSQKISTQLNKKEVKMPADVSSKPSFLSRIWSPFKLFFISIFGKKDSSKKDIKVNTNSSSKSQLEGEWAVEETFIFDKTLNSFRKIPDEKRYIEFKGDQVCPDGTFLPSGLPITCQHYSLFHVEGNKIITDGIPAGQTITWRFVLDKLELTIESENKTTAQTRKMTLSKIENFNPVNISGQE